MKIVKILLLSFLFTSILLGQTVTIKDYNITYEGVDYDYANNTSTWKYTVSAVGSDKDLSHWVVGLCQDHDVLASNVSPYEVPSNGDPTTGVYGIKWDKQVNVGQTKLFTFTLDGIYDEAEVEAAIKTGGKKKTATGFITGPACDEVSYKASLGDYVWHDENEDGIQDASEEGVEKVVVKLFDCNDDFIKSTETDEDGKYLFDDLQPGDYYVQFILPEGYVFTEVSQTDDNSDSDADRTSGKTECTTLENNENDMSWDAGIYQPGPDCIDDWTITINNDETLCEYEAKWIEVDGFASISPDPAEGTLKTYWKIIAPENEATDNEIHTEQKEINSSSEFTINAYWPGITSENTYIAIEVGAEILDCDGNKIKDSVSKVIYWNPDVCDPPADEKPDLEIEKEVDNDNPSNGDVIKYTVKVKNNGPGKATNVIVNDLLANGLDFISSNSNDYDFNTGNWTVGNLTEGETKTLELNVKIDISDVNDNEFDFGEAEGFNLFVFGDLYQPSADTEGKVAVGGDAYFSNYSIGDKLGNSYNDENVLVVGGNLTYVSGGIYHGNVVYGNSSNLPKSNVSIMNGELIKDAPIDFNAAEQYLKGLSKDFAKKDENGTVTYEYGTLAMTGNDPFINVFNVDGGEFSESHTKKINVPNGAVVLVNIAGNSVEVDGGLFIEGTSVNNVLFNFHEANDLYIHNIDVKGSVLAPFAKLNFPSGVINGQVIVKSVGIATKDNRGQFNNKLFIGNIPGDTEINNLASIASMDQEDSDESNNNSEVGISVEVSSEDNNQSDNSQTNWEKVDQLGTGEIIYTFAEDMNGDQLLGTWGGKIYRFDGEYTLINDDEMNVAFIWDLEVSSNGTIYAATEKGVYISEDNGSTWSSFGLENSDIRALAINSSDELFAGIWGEGVKKYNGSNWEEVNNSLNNLAVHALVFNSDDDLYVGTFGGGISILENGSSDWTVQTIDYPFIWTLAVTDNNLLFAGTFGDGVYLSNDDGQTWTRKNDGISATHIYSISVEGENVVVGTWSGGVYKYKLNSNNQLAKSSTANLSWDAIGLGGINVSSLYIDSKSDLIYAGTKDGSIYKVSSEVTDVEENREQMPNRFALHNNYPNPFNPSTTISFDIAKQGNYELKVYNVLGEEVATLINKELNPGTHSLKFNAENVSSGIYFYRLSGEGFVKTKKMMLLK